jgi:hypothetical protein
VADRARVAGIGLEVARAGYGVSLLRRRSTMDRVLGGRLLVQGALTVVRGGDELTHGAGAGVDVLHAASMVGLAAVSRRWRRRALVSAAVATAFAVAEVAQTLHTD